jgi:hypothetical protein
MEMAEENQMQSVKDLKNIAKARLLGACNDPACLADLVTLEREARDMLKMANRGMELCNTKGGMTVWSVAPPYPPTY